MAGQRAPKQWSLTKSETITSFENWKQNLMYILSLDNNFSTFLTENYVWQKKTATRPHRGFTDDGDGVHADRRKTAGQKNAQIELMLGQIANYCPVISRSSITKNSTSLNEIWQLVRQHYGFQSSGAHFLDLSTIKLEADERHEDLFQRLAAFFDDNLLTATGSITHHGERITVDEDLTPTLENTIVVLWLQLINPALPQIVKQKYGSELRNKSLASLQPEISQAMASLLDEIRSIEEVRVCRTGSFQTQRRFSKQKVKSCILCKTAGRPSGTHYLYECRFLPEDDRRVLRSGRARFLDCDEDDDVDANAELSVESVLIDPPPTARRVNIEQSPYLNVYHEQFPVRLTLDTGATTNMILSSFAKSINLPVHPASQLARQADGVTPLHVVGEVHCQLTRSADTFQLDALVVDKLDVDILAGNPFHVTNDIATRPARHQVVIGGSKIVTYGVKHDTSPSVRRTQAFLLRSPPQQTVILPGDYIQLETPLDCDPDTMWAMEPRFDCPVNDNKKDNNAWPKQQEVASVDHSIRLLNNTVDPILLRRGEHICQVREINTVHDNKSSPVVHAPSTPPVVPHKPYSASVTLNPDKILSPTVHDEFAKLNKKYDDVFSPTIAKYNGASGKIEATVNMGPTLPPQRKGRVPQYNRTTLVELQEKFDELEAAGVFAKPEQANTSVEYLNISFLVKKPTGGSRLVTSFGEVGKYSKPQPSLMPNVDIVLRDISRWRYLIATDLLQSFYQIPLSHASMKYCGVTTPYKGIRVYTRCAMGMPGSEKPALKSLCVAYLAT